MRNLLGISELRDICRAHGLHLSKTRGQNFLIDKNLLSHLSEITVDDSNSSIIEIGAGLGNWTEYLARRAEKVYALEIDGKFYSILKQRMASYSNVEPIHADVLKFDFPRFFRHHWGERFIIAGNLPYRMSSPILFLWTDLYREVGGEPFQRASFMVQREVAQRMSARVGTPEYGRLTVMLAYYGRARIERCVPGSCFFPIPRVDSAFVSLTWGAGVRQRPQEDDGFGQVVRAAFGQRRKQLRNALAELEVPRQLSREEWKAVFERAGLDGSLRAGAVSPEAFVRLTRSLLRASPARRSRLRAARSDKR